MKRSIVVMMLAFAVCGTAAQRAPESVRRNDVVDERRDLLPDPGLSQDRVLRTIGHIACRRRGAGLRRWDQTFMMSVGRGVFGDLAVKYDRYL